MRNFYFFWKNSKSDDDQGHRLGFIQPPRRQLNPIRKYWGMIGRHQVHSKRFLRVSFTGECKLIFHKIDYLKTEADGDLFKFNDKILDSQQIPVELWAKWSEKNILSHIIDLPMTGRPSNMQQKISLFSPPSNSPWLGDLLCPLSQRLLKSTAQFSTNSTYSLREPVVRTSQALQKSRQVSRHKLPF